MGKARTLDQLGEVARDLQASPDKPSRQQRAVDQAVQLLGSCHYAGLTMVDDGRLSTVAATHDVVWQGDRAQYELNQGPCLDSVRSQHTVVSEDLRQESRWPLWSPYVVEHLGVRSMMALLLFTQERSYGALNLYSRTHDGFRTDDIVTAEALAATIAVAEASAAEIAHRGTAMVNRTVIGQAQGILMERYGISDARAFCVLQRLSQRDNVKLTSLAATLVETRNLDGLPDGPGAAQGLS